MALWYSRSLSEKWMMEQNSGNIEHIYKKSHLNIFDQYPRSYILILVSSFGDIYILFFIYESSFMTLAWYHCHCELPTHVIRCWYCSQYYEYSSYLQSSRDQLYPGTQLWYIHWGCSQGTMSRDQKTSSNTVSCDWYRSSTPTSSTTSKDREWEWWSPSTHVSYVITDREWRSPYDASSMTIW